MNDSGVVGRLCAVVWGRAVAAVPHLADMPNRKLRPRGRKAQQKIVVFGAVKSAAPTARLLRQRLANACERRQVMGGSQQFGVPVGLEGRAESLALGVDQVLVGIDKLGLGVKLERAGHMKQRERRQPVVLAQARDMAAHCAAQNGIERLRGIPRTLGRVD